MTKILREPQVYLIARQVVDEEELARFLKDEGFEWETDTVVPAERIAELAGMLCYLSFGKGRKSNKEYIETNLITLVRKEARRCIRIKSSIMFDLFDRS